MQKLGFGCMRLPMKGNEVDYDQFNKMIDAFMKNGFSYFDTAHGYLQMQSEIAIGKCLTSKYPRESYVLTDKLTGAYFQKQEDIIPLFNEQLRVCNVDYFDYYLMHSQNAREYEKFKRCKAYETAIELKKQGKIKHFGISFHDKATVLEKILQEYPEIEVVQIQFNYVDYNSPAIESKKVYDVARKYNKDVIIMEPLKGGKLIDLPELAQNELDKLNIENVNANLALRFAASFDGVVMVLSGMSSVEQVNQNVKIMNPLKTLNKNEFDLLMNVSEIINNQDLIKCTSCRYCVAGCPKKIDIPNLFSCMNQKHRYKDWNSEYYYNVHTKNGNGKASDCISCRQCENICPQHLPITELLKEIAKTFER